MPAGVIELQRHSVLAVDLDPVDRGVDPAVVGIAHDDDRARADERAAVAAVPDRRREFGEVDRLAFASVPEKIRVRDGDRPMRL